MKRGQFYIVTTIMIVAIIVGFASLSNYSQKRSTLKFFYEGEELELEASKVIDYGITQSLSGALMMDQLETFAKDYMDYSNADNFYFVLGVKNSQGAGSTDTRFFMMQKTDTTPITIYFDGGEIIDDIGEGAPGENHPDPPRDFAHNTDWINLTIPDSDGELRFDFKMGIGSNFYYVMTKEIGGDRYLETNA